MAYRRARLSGWQSVPVVKGLGEAGKLLTTWQADGTAAGNRGDLDEVMSLQ